MARLGPWDGERRVAVAVSGGADSLALAVLAARWGNPLALIVDHGLRATSAEEAQRTRATLAWRGIPARVLTLAGLAGGAGLQARARTARYAAMEAATAAAGLVDLLLGHHAGDQAETVLMRQRRGSGPLGMAGMASLAEGLSVRRVRPLLDVAPERLRAVLRAEGLPWIEDPSNADPSFTRVRLRREIGAGASAGPGHEAGEARAVAERIIAAVLAERASLHPEGYAVITPGPLLPAALSRLLHVVGGRPYAPAAGAVAALAGALRPATLGGVQIRPAGRLGPGWLLLREASAMAPPVPLRPGTVWDRRYAWVGPPGQAGTLGALGVDAAAFRCRILPSCVLATLPAIRRNGVVASVPFLGYDDGQAHGSATILCHNAAPACGAAFLR